MTNNSKIAKAKLIDTVSASYKLEAEKKSQMERLKNVECTGTKRLEFDWTE